MDGADSMCGVCCCFLLVCLFCSFEAGAHTDINEFIKCLDGDAKNVCGLILNW